MKVSVSAIIFLVLVSACSKCNLKGDQVLYSDFDDYNSWELYSEYSATDDFYSRIENGALKLKSDQENTFCQRATYKFDEDFSDIKGFQACIHINELRLPKNVDVQFYFSLGEFEMHGSIMKRKSTNTRVVFRVDNNGVSSNMKGALFGRLGNEMESDNYDSNFIQIALCPEEDEQSSGELYIEIESLEITVLK